MLKRWRNYFSLKLLTSPLSKTNSSEGVPPMDLPRRRLHNRRRPHPHAPLRHQSAFHIGPRIEPHCQCRNSSPSSFEEVQWSVIPPVWKRAGGNGTRHLPHLPNNKPHYLAAPPTLATCRGNARKYSMVSHTRRHGGSSISPSAPSQGWSSLFPPSPRVNNTD